MDIPFNMGDPVQVIIDPNRVGTVIGLIESTFDSQGNAVRPAQVVVRPPLKKYTSTLYYVGELILCRCAARTKRWNKCEKNAPF